VPDVFCAEMLNLKQSAVLQALTDNIVQATDTLEQHVGTLESVHGLTLDII
jgi:hypothetical protein